MQYNKVIELAAANFLQNKIFFKILVYKRLSQNLKFIMEVFSNIGFFFLDVFSLIHIKADIKRRNFSLKESRNRKVIKLPKCVQFYMVQSKVSVLSSST